MCSKQSDYQFSVNNQVTSVQRIYPPPHHHHKAFRNKSHTSHSQRLGSVFFFRFGGLNYLLLHGNKRRYFEMLIFLTLRRSLRLLNYALLLTIPNTVIPLYNVMSIIRYIMSAPYKAVANYTNTTNIPLKYSLTLCHSPYS